MDCRINSKMPGTFKLLFMEWERERPFGGYYIYFPTGKDRQNWPIII
jgi:hypothetical protein